MQKVAVVHVQLQWLDWDTQREYSNRQDKLEWANVVSHDLLIRLILLQFNQKGEQ